MNEYYEEITDHSFRELANYFKSKNSMGTIQHHCVIATTWDQEEMVAFKTWVNDEYFFMLGPQTHNGYRTVCLVPDGSKEGWEQSDWGDERRVRFIEWLNSRNHWQYVEVSFGELGSMIKGNVNANT